MILWSVLFWPYIGYMLSLSVNDSMMLVVYFLSIMISDIDIIPIHPQLNTCTETCASFTDRQDGEPQEVLSPDTEEHRSSADTDQDTARSYTTIRPVGKSVDWSVAVDNQQTDEDVMQISGAGHWFLEGWIGDHPVDFRVDSGSAVTAVSRSFFNTLSEAGAPVGVLRPTARRLRRANGSHIDIFGCSSCVVSFLGLRTEFLGVYIATHAGHKERFAVHRGRGVASATSKRCRLVWTCLHSGTLLHSTTF